MGASINPAEWLSKNGQIVRIDEATRKEVVIATFFNGDTDTEERRQALKFVMEASKLYTPAIVALKKLVAEQPRADTVSEARGIVSRFISMAQG